MPTLAEGSWGEWRDAVRWDDDGPTVLLARTRHAEGLRHVVRHAPAEPR